MNLLERGRDFAPGHVTASGRAPVIFAGMDVFQAGAGRANGIPQIFFFDVHMKSIEHDLAGGMGNAIYNFNGLRSKVDKTGFKTVEWFDA